MQDKQEPIPSNSSHLAAASSQHKFIALVDSINRRLHAVKGGGHLKPETALLNSLVELAREQVKNK